MPESQKSLFRNKMEVILASNLATGGRQCIFIFIDLRSNRKTGFIFCQTTEYNDDGPRRDCLWQVDANKYCCRICLDKNKNTPKNFLTYRLKRPVNQSEIREIQNMWWGKQGRGQLAVRIFFSSCKIAIFPERLRSTHFGFMRHTKQVFHLSDLKYGLN